MMSVYRNKQYMYVAVEVSEGKTLGEMWAAVIRNINNLLWTGWLRTRAPIGDKDGVSWCSEGDHARHIREVPQEGDSPSMYIVK
jgi:hypothetical protein